VRRNKVFCTSLPLYLELSVRINPEKGKQTNISSIAMTMKLKCLIKAAMEYLLSKRFRVPENFHLALCNNPHHQFCRNIKNYCHVSLQRVSALLINLLAHCSQNALKILFMCSFAVEFVPALCTSNTLHRCNQRFSEAKRKHLCDMWKSADSGAARMRPKRPYPPKQTC